jgi:hypothetical protein
MVVEVLSIVKLLEVNGEPKAKLDLPGPLRIGDPIALRFRIDRQTGGRSETLEVNGVFLVRAVGFDASGPQRQLLSVEAKGVGPTWKSVKKSSLPARRLGPTHFPKTAI